MNSILNKYIKVFSSKHLRYDRAHGKAPHKPILLLSILQTVLNGLINENKIYITPELVAQFKANWSLLVISNHECKFALPFYHLIGDKFWRLTPKSGYENIIQLKSSMRSFSNLNAAVEYAIMDDDLWTLINDKESNLILQQFLLEEYFPETKSGFSKSLTYSSEILDKIENSILHESSDEYKKEIITFIQKDDVEEVFLRGAIFKREIPKLYNFTCCISGLQIHTINNTSMVDACHIVPFSQSFDDTVLNGICLSPNLHRAFDRYLITINDEYRVIVSDKFNESGNHLLKPFHKKTIHLPTETKYLPNSSNLQWHNQQFWAINQ